MNPSPDSDLNSVTKPHPWVSIARGNANNRFEQAYCEYCLNKYKKYYPLVNNVCQSCGLAPKFIKDVNQQANVKLGALDDKIRGDNNSSNFFKGVTLDIEYPELENDYNRIVTNSRNDRMVARSASEAMHLINKVERQNSRYYQPFANLKFRTKAADKGLNHDNRRTFKSDNPNETEL